MAKPSKNSPKPKIKAPSTFQVIDAFSQLFNEKTLFDEPMYDLDTENIKKLESALKIPFASFSGKEKYQTLEEKTAALFYIVTKNHDFNNGNKRTAIILSLLFLRVNNHWLSLSEKEMYNLSIEVASNTNKNHEKNIGEITKIFKKHLRPL